MAQRVFQKTAASYTFNEKPNGNYNIRQVCYWEVDPFQLKFIDFIAKRCT